VKLFLQDLLATAWILCTKIANTDCPWI